MTSQYRHRRTSNSATAFPTLEPGEIAVNTANRQIAAGDASVGTPGSPINLLAVRNFSAGAQYVSTDLVVNNGVIYSANGSIPPGAFNSTQWTQITSDPTGFVKKTGDTMTGAYTINNGPLTLANCNLLLQSAAYAAIILNKGAGANQNLIYGRGSTGAEHWILAIGDNAAESGSNAGSNFVLSRYNDSGGYLGTPLSIQRNSGLVQLSDSQITGNLSISGLCTVGTTAGEVIVNGGNPVVNLNKMASGGAAILYGQTNGLSRWMLEMGNATGESGGNNGSDLAIIRCADNGNGIDAPLVIFRQSGVVQVNELNSQDQVTAANQITSSGNINAANNIVANNIVQGANIYTAGAGAVNCGYVNTNYDIVCGRNLTATTSLNSPVCNLSSQLAITSSSPSIVLNKTVGGAQNLIFGESNGGVRWYISLGDTSPESGGNAGANFGLIRCNDGGVGIDNCFGIRRSDALITTTGQINVMGNLALNSLGVLYQALSYGANAWVGFGYDPTYGLFLINGNAGAYAYYVANAGISDERLKQDIAPSTHDCLAEIETIDLYQFRWKDHSTIGEPAPAPPDAPLVPCGLVAQRLYEVAPHLVQKGDEHGTFRDKVTRERARDAGEGGDNIAWSINTNNLIASLVGAVQQLSARVAALEAR